MSTITNITSLEANAQKSLKSDSIDILHYDIHLDIIHLSQKKIQGYTELTLTPKMNNVNNVYLDLLKLSVDSVYINDTISLFSYNDTLLDIHLMNPINLTDTINLKVFYHGQPITESSGWGGFHFSNDSSLAYNLGVALQDAPHNYGRVWYPCIDDFIDRALYDFYIKVKDDKTAVCGGTMVAETNNFDGTKTYHWKLSNSIPTYLASVAVSNYIAIKDTFNGINDKIPIFIYIKLSDNLKAKASFINLKAILSAYENNFGSYRWERVGYVGTTQGAMEHATNIAYPTNLMDGTLNYEWLLAHELSHHWFGDLVTCHSAEDMWLNEGWATFCEFIYKEVLSGKEAYKDYVRNNHEYVLREAHIRDSSYLPIYGIPSQQTYGTTVYNKGAGVVHTLRGYLEDSLFFSTCKEYLNQYAFKDISTQEFRDFITNYTGINMNDFFDAWVMSSGFPHFSVDSFRVTQTSLPESKVTVYTKQKWKGPANLANSNKAEITFMDSSWNIYTDVINFSGQTDSATFIVPFAPDVVMLDIDEKLCDATTDCYKTINSTGIYNYTATRFQLDVQQLTDSAFVRVEHNWVAPDSLKTPIKGLTLSDYRYWKIDGIFPVGFNAKGRFSYSIAGLDNTLITNSKDSLIILYRADVGQDWQPISFTRTGTPYVGTIYVNNIKKGEYTLAVWDEDYLNINDNKSSDHDKISLNIYPNPSCGEFTFNYKIQKKSVIRIYNAAGDMVDSISIYPHKDSVIWKPDNLTQGCYIAEMYSIESRNIPQRVKIIYIK